MKFVRVDTEGYITAYGDLDRCPEGAIAVPDDFHVSLHGNRKKLIDGRAVDTGEPLFPISYTVQRAANYPSVGDQLGAIWKAIAPLIENAEAEAILAKIQAVKDANPKPTN